MNTNLSKNLYEVKTSFRVDPSKASCFIVNLKVDFNDLDFLSHVKSGNNFSYARINASYGFFGRTWVYFSNGYSQWSDHCFKFEEVVNSGVNIGFKDEKYAVDFIKKIEMKIRKEFNMYETRYLRAKSLAALHN
jgi:hypothetical protein